MTKSLTNKVALVTGATSGIGAATATVLAACGASVMLIGRNQRAAQTVQKEIEAAGGTAKILLGDICAPEFCQHAVAETIRHFHQLDILANVAGVIRRGDSLNTSDDDWRVMMSTNVDGTFFMSRAAIAVMRTGGGGSIINLGSTVGLVGTEGLAAYCASKGAVVNLTRAMALDHATEGIRINAVCPGAVDTPMLISGHNHQTPEKVHDSNRSAIPQQRIPAPSEIADLISFLASDASRHITGTAIPIDGGYTAR